MGSPCGGEALPPDELRRAILDAVSSALPFARYADEVKYDVSGGDCVRWAEARIRLRDAELRLTIHSHSGSSWAEAVAVVAGQDAMLARGAGDNPAEAVSRLRDSLLELARGAEAALTVRDALLAVVSRATRDGTIARGDAEAVWAYVEGMVRGGEAVLNAVADALVAAGAPTDGLPWPIAERARETRLLAESRQARQGEAVVA